MYYLKFTLLTSFLLFNYFVHSQNVDLYFSNTFPAKPVGKVSGVEQMVKDAMVFPAEELALHQAYELYISFKVDQEGRLRDVQPINSTNKNFEKEAIRLLKMIVWEKDEKRELEKIGTEKIKISFKPKKYSKLLQKRKKDKFYLPRTFENLTIYNATQLDSLPRVIGFESINDFVNQHMKYPSLALQQGISGKVTLQFVIEPYGKVSNIKLVNAVAGGCNDETMRLIKLINWQPAIKDNQAVRVLYEYTLNFNHPGGTFR